MEPSLYDAVLNTRVFTVHRCVSTSCLMWERNIFGVWLGQGSQPAQAQPPTHAPPCRATKCGTRLTSWHLHVLLAMVRVVGWRGKRGAHSRSLAWSCKNESESKSCCMTLILQLQSEKKSFSWHEFRFAPAQWILLLNPFRKRRPCGAYIKRQHFRIQSQSRSDCDQVKTCFSVVAALSTLLLLFYFKQQILNHGVCVLKKKHNKVIKGAQRVLRRSARGVR